METKETFLQRYYTKKRNWFMYAVMAIALALFAIGVSGCKTVAAGGVVVTPPAVHKESYIQHKIDSVYIDRWHTVMQQGDTVRIHDSIYFSVVKLSKDTITLIDTIYTDPVLIEKPLTKTQSFMINSGWVAWAILVLLILAVIVGVIIKVAK